MKTSFNIKTLVLVFFASLSLSVFAQPMSINGKKGNDTNGDNLMPMTINGPKAKSSADNNTGGDNLMPMSINSPKKSSALFGFIQAGNQSAQVTLQVGKNTIQFPGIETKYTAEITEDFQLYTLADMLRSDLKATITPVNAPENYTDPGSAKFFALSIPTGNGKVVKGILAIGTTGNNPFSKLPDPLPYWWD
jgi:hypothetical protein